jgi:hypothetical protein
MLGVSVRELKVGQMVICCGMLGVSVRELKVGQMVICCGMLGVSVRELKVMTVKVETVTLSGKVR